MRLVTRLIAFSLFAGGLASAQQFVARLQPKLVANDQLFSGATFHDASGGELGKFSPALDHPAKVRVGVLELSSLSLPAALVKQADGRNCVYVDGEGKGRFTPAGRVCLESSSGQGNYADGGSLDVRLGAGPVAAVPVIFHTPKPVGDKVGNQPTLLFSYHVMAEGILPVEGRSILVAWDLNLKTGAIDPKQAVTYLDQDGDGRFDNGRERKYTPGTAPTFHVGSRYLYTENVDLKTHRAVFGVRDPEQVMQIDFAKGDTLPDFAFVDFDGKHRTLSSVKGKVVLIDFWATWCEACVADLPRKKAVYDKLHTQGFEILGIDGDGDSQQKPNAMVKKLGLTWPEAQFDSDLVTKRFEITMWPTAILINDKRQVLTTDLKQLSGDQLESTIRDTLRR